MQKLFYLLLVVPLLAFGAATQSPIQLEHIRINTGDQASLARGAKFFASNCMVCHSMKYLQHNKIAAKAGITLAKMPLKNQDWWLGITPPDLTLIGSQRGADWLYTYFHSFYKDKSRPTGYNNLLTPNVNMMNVFAPMQGEQILTESPERLFHNLSFHKPRYYSVLKLERSGSMTPAQFDAITYDLVNFLVYASEPARLQRESLGWWVLGFLVVLLVIAFLLYKEYWKRVK